MKILLILSSVFILLITGCAQEKLLSFTIEDLNKEVFSSGIYYQYSFKNNKDIDAELILNNLIKSDIPLVEAWYKNYASSCCPPDTNRCMQAIIEPVFIIRLTEETELKDFVRVENPDIGWCAYYVTHYELK